MANKNIKITISAEDQASRVIEGAAGKINGASESVSNKSREAADKFTSHFGFIATGIRAAAATAVTGGAALIGFGLTSGAQLQNTAASFKALTGDAATAKSLFTDLYDFARGTPFAFPDVTSAAKTLLGYGRTAQQVKNDVKVLGGMVATTGADWSRLAVVYGQVNAAGQLYAQDALQLIENGVPITTALAKDLGISIQDVKKRMEEGAISAEDFNRSMAKMVPADAIEQMSNTMTGKLSGLTGSVRNLAFSLVGIDYSQIEDGGPLLVKQGGLFDRLTKGVEGLSKKLSEPKIKDALSKIGNAMADVVEGGGRILLNFISWASSNMGLLQAAATALGFAFVSMKVGNVVADFAALVRVVPTVSAALALFNLNPVVLGISAVVGVVAALGFGMDALRASSGQTSSAIDAHKAAQDRLAQTNRDAKLAQDALNGAVLSAEGANLNVERAQRAYNDAVAQYGPKSLEAREAAYQLKEAENRLAEANENVRRKTEEARQAQDNRAKAEGAVKATSERIGGAVAGEAAQWSNLAGRINEAAEARNRGEFKSALPTMNAAPGLKNAIGTAYSPGGRTLVGEHGPEIVNMPRGSQVTQAYRTRNELNSGGDGGGVTNILSGNFTFNNQEASDAFFNRLDSTQRLAKVGM
ncbi:tape measure protein [Rhodococcus qingshengii]|uniref:tape measure protein n=1 Tax=Rhodococcus qingshengii TaxID=334542 RepID=UPI000AF98B1F|nr:tape measure protein [Rhodococcus qingshengii]MCZ4544916.1 tape measure protein [Rhodococcus qingshengii]